MLNEAYSSDEESVPEDEARPTASVGPPERSTEPQPFSIGKSVSSRTLNAPGGGQMPAAIFRDKNWAKKSFLMSGDLIFPGMKGGDAGGRGDPGLRSPMGWDLAGVGSQVRTSVFMQMVLHASSVAFLVWIVLYLLSIQTMMILLKEIHAKIYCIMFAVFVATNAARLYVGASGNKTDTTNMVSTYCVITAALQALPLLFLLLSNIWVSEPCYHLISADIVLLVHLALEVLATFHRLSLLLADEVEIIRLEETVKKSAN